MVCRGVDSQQQVASASVVLGVVVVDQPGDDYDCEQGDAEGVIGAVQHSHGGKVKKAGEAHNEGLGHRLVPAVVCQRKWLGNEGDRDGLTVIKHRTPTDTAKARQCSSEWVSTMWLQAHSHTQDHNSTT